MYICIYIYIYIYIQQNCCQKQNIFFQYFVLIPNIGGSCLEYFSSSLFTTMP